MGMAVKGSGMSNKKSKRNPCWPLTGLELGPVITGHTDILVVDLSVGEQEPDGLSQSLQVEVVQLVGGHFIENSCSAVGGERDSR